MTDIPQPLAGTRAGPHHRCLPEALPSEKIARPAWVRKYDCWAAGYDSSQLQAVLYGPVHDAVLRYARQHVQHPDWILDVGCGTGRLLIKLESAYRQAQLAGVDASAGMINQAVTAPGGHRIRFTAAAAERLPFANASFDLVTATLSVSHLGDAAAGLAEISRVMAPNATLLAADVCRARPPRSLTVRPRRPEPDPPQILLPLVAASGLRIRAADPIRSVALIADAVLVAATKQN